MVDLIKGSARFGKWLGQALIIQLFVLSLSFPILVSWGIAFSPLIFLGNILFTPLLTLFLAFSCLIYIFELCYIPSDYICTALDAIAHFWMTGMSWAPDLPMIGCPQAPFWLLILMPLGSWVIVRSYGFRNVLVTLSFLMIWVSTVFCGIKWYFTPPNKEIELSCGSRSVIIKRIGERVIFIDSESVLQSRACSHAWIDYTLSSELIKKLGATTIDIIIVQKTTPAALQRLKQLCARYRCKKVFDRNGILLQI